MNAQHCGASQPDEAALVLAAVRRQESIGLRSVTDGEFRRDWWHLDFLTQLDGVGLLAHDLRRQRHFFAGPFTHTSLCVAH